MKDIYNKINNCLSALCLASSLYASSCTSTTQQRTIINPERVISADFDNDGKNEKLVVYKEEQTFSLYAVSQDSIETLIMNRFLFPPKEMGAKDINKDKYLDIMFYYNGHKAILNDGKGGFINKLRATNGSYINTLILD